MSEDASEGTSEVAGQGDANRPVLEPEEINALMASMAPDEEAEAMFASLPPLAQPEAVESYDFSGADDNGPSKYPLFINVLERMIEDLNEQWSDLFKHDLGITLQGAKLRNYLEIISEEKPKVFFAFAVEGHGRMMVTFDTELIVAYVDAMLGGKGEACGEHAESLSPVERRLAERIAVLLKKQLEEAWKPVHGMSFELFKIETDPQFLAVAASGESCFSCDMDIALVDDGARGSCSIHYPRPFLEPILDNLRAPVGDDSGPVDSVWAAELDQAMESVPLSLRVVLGHCTMDIGGFLNLSPGDLLPLRQGEQEPSVLWAGSMPMYQVRAGSQNGKLAIEMLDKINSGGAS